METQARSRVAREEWAKRVERWCESGLTSAEFAAELGINSRTLTYWKWVLSKEARVEERERPSRKSVGRARQLPTTGAALKAALPELVEVHTTTHDARFELELGAGRRLRVPANFDAMELRRLLDLLEAP